MKKLNLSLTRPNDIDNVIKYLEDYKSTLDSKADVLIQRLSRIGIIALNARIKSISPFYKGEDIDTSVSEVYKTDNGWGAKIMISGSQCVFIEFGAGVTFNTSKGNSLHPKGQELGLTIGSYNPNSDNATKSSGWWYTDKWGESQHTYGTPTFAPLYNSSLEMLEAIQGVTEEVFSNG